MSEEQSLRRLWFHKEVVTELCHLLHTDLEARTSLSVAVTVTVALGFHVTGSFRAPGGDIDNILQFAVHCCICLVTFTLYSRRMDYISFSMSMVKQEKRSCGFTKIAGIPMVQDAIDCTHMTLQAPPQSAEVYCNRKGYHSLNIQLVCDHRQIILAQRYNESQAASRNIVEQTIRLQKQQFRCLDRSGGTFQYSPDRVSIFTIVCNMLHNLAIMGAQLLAPGRAAPPQEEEDDEDDQEAQHGNADQEKEQQPRRRQRA
uniref:putative nuclease HARBI1 n=1 Tax=Pristiophorus japonicus TaxID=55135 RepID=UPI00398F6B59